MRGREDRRRSGLDEYPCTDQVGTAGARGGSVELEYHTTGGEATRLEFGLDPEHAAGLGANLTQLGEKLPATEH